jgi:hypothetical protein
VTTQDWLAGTGFLLDPQWTDRGFPLGEIIRTLTIRERKGFGEL